MHDAINFDSSWGANACLAIRRCRQIVDHTCLICIKFCFNYIIRHKCKSYSAGLKKRTLQKDHGWGEKRKLDLTGFKVPYDPGYSDDEEYEYVSGEDMDVDDGNFGSFKAKEEDKIGAKGNAYYYNGKTNTWRCTTKPKPKSDRVVHLLTHAEDVAIHDEDYKIRGSMVPSRKS